MIFPDMTSDDYVVEFDFKPCPYHKLNPGGIWHGCTCHGSYKTRKATTEERESNRKSREERERKHGEALAKLYGYGRTD